MAESVEELEENGHQEEWNDQPDEWNDQVDHATDQPAFSHVLQDSGNLETVAEEDGTNLTAIALYDYQAGADDELSFDPDDIINNIEMIDEGWWRGECKGMFGLFPANYVQLQQWLAPAIATLFCYFADFAPCPNSQSNEYWSFSLWRKEMLC